MELIRPTLRLSSQLNLCRRALSSPSHADSHHSILIVGGGSGGIAMASRLMRNLQGVPITIVEPSDVHYYQPLWTLVGAGVKPMRESFVPTKKVIPKNVKWIKQKAVKFDPEHSTVCLDSDERLSYDQLIISVGFELRYDMIPGATEALDRDPRVVSNYSPKYLEKTFEAYKAFRGGRAIFTLPTGAIKCAGAPQKVMYLFEDYLRKNNIRDKADIQYFTALPKIFSVDKYSENLAEICRQRAIQVHLQHHLVEVNSAKSEVTVEDLTNKTRRSLTYDFLHITPPMTVPAALKSTPGLTNPDFVDVDQATLQHKRYKNIWSLGDCSSLPTSKTAAAVASQSAVLCENVIKSLKQSQDFSKYDGYTACPLITSYTKAIFAEFDYTMKPLETFPFDQGRESRLLYQIKAEVLPPLYWRLMLSGRWPGPSSLRRLFHPFSKR